MSLRYELVSELLHIYVKVQVLPELALQGYLAHKKQRFPRTLQQDYA